MDEKGAFRHNFAGMQNPRVGRRKRHKPADVVFIAAAAVISGADTFARACRVWENKAQVAENDLGIAQRDSIT